MNHEQDQLVENLFQDDDNFIPSFTGMSDEKFTEIMDAVGEKIAPIIDTEMEKHDMASKVNAAKTPEELKVIDMPIIGVNVYRAIGKIIDEIDAPFHVRILIMLETRKTMMRTIQHYLNGLFEHRLDFLVRNRLVVPNRKIITP